MKICLSVNTWHTVAHPRQGRWAKVPLSGQIYTSQWKKEQFYDLLSYCSPGLQQQQTQQKQRDWLSKENQIIVSELLFFKKCILPFPPFSNKGLEQPQEGSASLAVTPALHSSCHPVTTDCRGKPAKPHWFLELRVQGTDLYSIHLFYIFFTPKYVSHAGKMPWWQ